MLTGTRFIRCCALLLVLAVLACAPAQAPPSSTAQPAAPAPGVSRPEAAAPAGASGATAATPAWQAEWERTLAAARQEGKVEAGDRQAT